MSKEIPFLIMVTFPARSYSRPVFVRALDVTQAFIKALECLPPIIGPVTLEPYVISADEIAGAFPGRKGGG